MLKKTIYLAFCLLLVGSFVSAQQITSKLVGTVVDGDGNPLPGVTVEATSPKMVGKATAITDENGTFRLLSLVPGVYKLVFSLQGFQTLVREQLHVNIEQTISIKETLQLGKLEEEITVIGKSPLIDIKSTTKGMTLTKDVFEYLPKGRDFSTLVSVIPGVQSEDKFGGGISVDGASGAENTYYVDGMETSDIRGGRQAQGLAFEFVDEIQVKAAGYQAEHGGSMGGVVQVITRAGGNEFHGELLGYFSGSMLSGKERDTLRLKLDDSTQFEYVNYYDYYKGLGLQAKDYSTRLEAGFSLGGYIIKDRFWFFGSVLPVFNRTNREVQFQGGNISGSYDSKDDYLNYQAKLTAAPFSGLRLSASYVNNAHKLKGALPAKDGSGNPDYPFGKYGFDYPDMTVGGTIDYTIGNNLLLSVRGGYFKINQLNQGAPKPTTPCIRFLYYVPQDSVGWPSQYLMPHNYYTYSWDDLFAINKAKYTRTSANFDTTYFVNLAGEHSWKAGFQFVRLHDDVFTPNVQPYVIMRIGRTYNFFDGITKAKGKYGYYEVRDPYSFPYKVDAYSNRFALYLQDSWTIGRKLTLNFGIRAEAEKIPSFSQDPLFKDKVPIDFGFGDKIAPRFGFIYDFFGDSTLKVYGSFSILNDCMKLAMPEGSYGGDQWWTTYYSLDSYEWDKIASGNYPGTYYEKLNWRMPSIENTDPDIKPVAQREMSFGIEKQLVENVSLSVRFTQRHLIRAIEDIGFATAEGESYIIGNPGYGLSSMADPVYPRCPKAKREYSAVNVTLEKRLSNNWLAGFGYTYSRLTGNYAGLDSSDEPGRNDPNVNRYWDLWFQMRDGNLKEIDGVLPTDRPHYFKAYASYVFPFGLNIGVAGFAYSGTPVTTEVTLNGQQGYYPKNRFDTGKRTPFTLFANLYAEYNLRIAKKYSINFNVNIDNVTNVKTAQYIYPYYNQDSPYLSDEELLASQGANYDSYVMIKDPRFMQKYNFFSPMSVRFGVKFIF